MPTLVERIMARFAFYHANRVYRRFHANLSAVETAQQGALGRALRLVAGSDFGARHGLHRVRTPAELAKALPIQTYEDLRPYIDRVREGEIGALLGKSSGGGGARVSGGGSARILMFAMSSGTTAQSKYIPVTPDFVADYRRGWNTFGLKMLMDHPAAVLRHILQSSGRMDESLAPSGVPCGAITGLLARTQKGIVRRFYVGSDEIAHISETRARQYTLMRCGIVRDVSFAVTANPATLLQLARIANEESERLIRDVRDGTVNKEMVDDAALRARIERGLRADANRARELERLRAGSGFLRPREYWKLVFLACWTGGSMGHYLPRLTDWYGTIPVRDVGLLASEGRVSIPLDDGTPAGVLDVTSGVFEFIPLEQSEAAHPPTVGPREVEVGRDYVVVLTNTAGLVRYRLDDVVRVRGWVGQSPLIEFLHRAGRVSSVAGEKLTENQVVAAVSRAVQKLGAGGGEFVMAPVWDDPPYYRLNTTIAAPRLAEVVDAELRCQNSEYDSRRSGGRLGAVTVRRVTSEAIAASDRKLLSRQGATAEQFKRPCLLTKLGADDEFFTPTVGV